MDALDAGYASLHVSLTACGVFSQLGLIQTFITDNFRHRLFNVTTMVSTQLYGLLQERGIDPTAQPVTLMRHKTGKYPLQKFLGTRALTLYQAMQLRPHKQGGLIIGFYGHQPGQGVLLGLWRITDVMPGQEAFDRGLLKESLEPFEEQTGGFYHELEELEQLADLRMKLEITWTGKEVGWRRVLQKANNYPVRLRPEPAVRGCAEFCVNGQFTAGDSLLVRKHNDIQKARSTRRTIGQSPGQLQEA